MQMIVLGCYGPYPPAGKSCSGYLLQEGGRSVLLDCGNGILSRLRYFIEPWELSAVIISHLHSDHISDLMIMRYALMMHRKKTAGTPLTVYAPKAPAAEYARLSYKSYLQTKPITEKTAFSVGKMQFSFTGVQHSVPAYLTTVRVGEKKFVYSGDTQYFSGLRAAASAADLFLCEAGYLQQDIEYGQKNHLSALQAAQTAKDANVKRLVLTHLHPERDPDLALLEAQRIFPTAELTQPGSLYQL